MQGQRDFWLNIPVHTLPWCLLSCVVQTLTMVSRKVVASLLLVYLVSLLAEQAEGFMPLFTHSDFQRMQEKERNKGGQKKSLSSLQQLDEEGSSEQPGVGASTARAIQQAVPVRPGMWLTPRQLEKYQDALEKVLAELFQDTPDAD
ncbi:promotilin isoform X1 [Neopelma chrysocephalum]|uniref:promotilin isoform X1 n=2 Tax=Neopelma chrysocephalum TaxID=114329 RepID=UPI000FCD197B|nr:promotilin isoform X1 [Neopelma chrysocephalum]